MSWDFNKIFHPDFKRETKEQLQRKLMKGRIKMGKVKDGTPREIHVQAVALRKLTDSQLMEKFAQVGVENLKKANAARETKTVGDFLRELTEADIRGIGVVTLKKLERFAKEKGYINAD